jgi:hypothetical protein
MSNPYLTCPWKVTDGGAARDGYIEEDSDCVPRAFAIAFQIPYRQAFLLCQRLGRTRNRGMHISKVVREAAAVCRHRATLLRRTGTVGQLLSWCTPHSVVLVEIDEHVFTIRRLQIHDLVHVPLRSKVLRAYLIQPL